jgi:hypothetical protein
MNPTFELRLIRMHTSVSVMGSKNHFQAHIAHTSHGATRSNHGESCLSQDKRCRVTCSPSSGALHSGLQQCATETQNRGYVRIAHNPPTTSRCQSYRSPLMPKDGMTQHPRDRRHMLIEYLLQSQLCRSLPTEWMSSSELAQTPFSRNYRTSLVRHADYSGKCHTFRFADKPGVQQEFGLLASSFPVSFGG